MARPCQSEINFSGREMQKGTYFQDQHYPSGFYQNTNGFNYEGSGQMGYGQATMEGYRSSCLMQVPPQGPVGASCGPLDYSQGYTNSCMQNISDMSGPGAPHPGNGTQSPINQKCGVGGPPIAHQTPHMGQLPQSGAEIFPWMKESRHNTKQRQVANVQGENLYIFFSSPFCSWETDQLHHVCQ